jgi:hypothetical protein
LVDVVPVVTEGPGKTTTYHWTLTTANPQGAPILQPGAADKTVQITSAAFGGATCIVEGSLDGAVNYAGMKDAFGSAVSATATGYLAALTEGALAVRPRLSVVGAGATVEVWITLRSTMR